MFDLSLWKLLVLGVLALIIFGPDRLPKIAAQAGRALRDLRKIAENAKSDLQEGLGPEFRDFDINDLNPRAFVRKHLWDDTDGGGNGHGSASPPGNSETQFPEPGSPLPGSPFPESPFPESRGGAALSPGESPPYDAEAT